MEKAPAFTLPDANGTPVALSDFKGQYVLIYFYPRASTPGCTTQACDLNSGLSALQRLGVQVIGISPDTQKSLSKFASDHSLRFPLLGDETHAVARSYGAWGPKTSYGKTYEGILRSSFAIAPSGDILHVWHNVKPATHYTEVLSWFREHFRAQ